MGQFAHDSTFTPTTTPQALRRRFESAGLLRRRGASGLRSQERSRYDPGTIRRSADRIAASSMAHDSRLGRCMTVWS